MFAIALEERTGRFVEVCCRDEIEMLLRFWVRGLEKS